MRSIRLNVYLCLWCLGLAMRSYAACGEALEAVQRNLTVEEQAVRTAEEAVRVAKAEFLSQDAALREVMTHPPAGYDQDLARRLIDLHRAEVEPKREMLERLRAQHEEARSHWERGRRLLQFQLVNARTEMQAGAMSREEYCRVREAHLQALRLYLQGIQGYRVGMDFYTRALAAYGRRFTIPYLQGFTNRQQWVELVHQLERGDFLQDILVPMTVNAIRSHPPEAPPE